MMGGRKNNYWYVTREESRQFIKWLKSLFGIKADKENSSGYKRKKLRKTLRQNIK